MPFTDTPDGQTHYHDDGCGEKLHNEKPKASGIAGTLPHLAMYAISRREMANSHEIMTTAGSRRDEHLIHAGMVMAYNDVIEWMERKGAYVTCIKK